MTRFSQILLCAVLWSAFGAHGGAPVLVGRWPDAPRLTVGESVCLATNLGTPGGSYALVAGGVSGVHVIDLRDPARVAVVAVADTPGQALSVAVDGSTGVVADGTAGLTFLDLRVPSLPTISGRFSTGGTLVDVAVEGDFAYALDSDGSLVVVNLSTLASPVLTARRDLGVGVRRVHVRDGTAYVAAASGLLVVSVLNPAAPLILSSFSSLGAFEDVAVNSGLVYGVDSSGGFSVLDMVNPRAPRLRSHLAKLADVPHGVAVLDGLGHLLVADGAGGGVLVDASNPDLPLVRQSITTGGDSRAVDASGLLACIVDRVGGARVLLLRDVNSIASSDVIGRISSSGRALAVAAEDSVLCLADGQAGLKVFDLADPAKPVPVTGYPPAGPAVTVAFRGGRSIVGIQGGGVAGLEVVAVGKDSQGRPAPELQGRYLIPTGADPAYAVSDLDFVDHWAYIAAGGAGLVAVDISDPTAPREAGRSQWGGLALGVTLTNGLAFVASGADGLLVLSLENPGNPVLLGRTVALPSGGLARGVTVRGGYAYVASGSLGLQIADISVPANPRWLGGLATGGDAVRVSLSGDMAIVSAGIGGVVLVDISNPAAPVKLGSFATDGQVLGTALARDQLYVADDSRLLIMAIAGLTSGPNLPPVVTVVANPVVNEDSGPAGFTNWLSGIRPGPASEAWQAVDLSIIGSSSDLFAEAPTISPEGILRFVPATNVFGTANYFLRVHDNGGVDNGGVDTTDVGFTITVRPVNDPPIMDSASDIGWRENSDGVVVLLSGLYAGPSNERTIQSLTVRAFSSKPDVIPNPIVEYNKGGSDARLLFRSVTNWSGRSNVVLTLILQDDAGTENGGIDTTKVELKLSVRPVDDPPFVQVIDPPDGAIVDPVFSSFFTITLRVRDEEGPIENLEIWADGVKAASFKPTSETPQFTLTKLARGPHVVYGVATDSATPSHVTTSAPVHFTLGIPPTITSTNTSSLVTDEDTLSPGISVRIADERTPASQLVPRVISSDPQLVPDDRIFLTGSGPNWTVSFLPATNAVGSAVLIAVVSDTDFLSASLEIPIEVRPVNDFPLVSITLPLEGARIRVGTPVTLRAISSDIDGEVGKVDFLDGTNLLGSASTPPYILVWTNASLGSHDLAARATDDLGGVGMSVPVRVTVELPPNEPPVVGIVGFVQTLEDTVSAPLLIHASDDRTPVEFLKVTLSSGDPLVVPDDRISLVTTANPWRLTVAPATNRFGTNSITLMVSDSEGAVTTHLIRFEVTSADDPPTVAIVSPADGATFVVGDPVPITVSAQDVDDSVNRVALFSDRSSSSLLSTPSARFDFVWTNAPLGDVILTARARDTLGSFGTSAPVRITIVPPPNRPPVITADGTSLVTAEDTASAAVRWSIADDRTGAGELKVTAVSLAPLLVLDSGISLSRTGNVWSISFVPVTNATGSGALRLVAMDAEGLATTNDLPVTVTPVNDLPTVVLTSPLQSAVFDFGSTILLEAGAVDVEGAVAKVEFLADNVSLGSSVLGPYSYSWKGATAGEHVLKARVTDGGGLTVDSPEVRITVNLPANRPPVITPDGASLVTAEDTASGAVRWSITDDRTGAGELKVTAVSLAPLLVVNSGISLSRTGNVWSISFLPVTNATGSGALRLVAMDAEGLATTKDLPVTVTPVNRAPTITGGVVMTLYRDGVSPPIPLTVGDDRTPLDSLTLRASSSDSVLFPRTNLVLAGTGASRTLTLVPGVGAFGSAVVEVVVSDNEGLTASTVFRVTVLPVSELPGGEECFADGVPAGYGTFNLLKHANYAQEVGGDPRAVDAAASIELRAPPKYSILSATVSGVPSFRVNLLRRDDGLFLWSESGDEAGLLVGLPFGAWNTTYRLVLPGGQAFSGFFPFTIVSNVPPAPRLLNLDAARFVNASAPFALSWLPWTQSGTNDRVLVTLVDGSGKIAYSAASDCSGETVLQRRSAGIQIPAGTLTADTSYSGYLTFGATQLSVNDSSPLLMLRAYHSRTTQFGLRTLAAGGGAAASFGSPRVFGSSLVVTMRGTSGVTYGIEASPDLVVWSRMDEIAIPSSGSAELAIPYSLDLSRRYFRAVVVAKP